jgi:ubiquinone/menaquinone biosynthesis C-methylase UbiE
MAAHPVRRPLRHARDRPQSRLVEIARGNLRRAGLKADVRVGDVQALPYANDSFDTVINTMAFSGYPDGRQALSELTRVLCPGGRLIILDVNYPSDDNRVGTALVELWKRTGDLIRDLPALCAEFDLVAADHEIGGFGSVHVYLATKPTAPTTQPPT